MFALLTVKNLRKIQMIGLGSVTSLCRGKESQTGRGSVVFRPFEGWCVRIYVFNYTLILLM